MFNITKTLLIIFLTFAMSCSSSLPAPTTQQTTQIKPEPIKNASMEGMRLVKRTNFEFMLPDSFVETDIEDENAQVAFLSKDTTIAIVLYKEYTSYSLHTYIDNLIKDLKEEGIKVFNVKEEDDRITFLSKNKQVIILTSSKKSNNIVYTIICGGDGSRYQENICTKVSSTLKVF